MEIKNQSIQQALRDLANPAKANNLKRFFKTGPGQYGEGDLFIGLTVPQIRSTAKKFRDLNLKEIQKLLKSKIHEERLTSLIILVNQFKKASPEKQKEIYDFYLQNTQYVNNWDLVDSSAAYIIGPYLEDKPKTILTTLAHSKNLWERRIAMLSTFHYIKKGENKEALRIATILLHDKHDLIHKAVGWMLREIGKNSGPQELEKFLQKNYRQMPRTMLRYAIEHFSESKRQNYLKK